MIGIEPSRGDIFERSIFLGKGPRSFRIGAVVLLKVEFRGETRCGAEEEINALVAIDVGGGEGGSELGEAIWEKGLIPKVIVVVFLMGESDSELV